MAEAATLPRSAPEAQGIPSTAIQAFVDAVERQIHDLHSFMLLRRGTVVAEGWWEPYGPQIPHVLFSLSKSFTSTAIGMLAAEGRLAIDTPVLSFFPDQAPKAPDANLRAMRVKHLLTMSTGHAQDTIEQLTGDWAGAFLEQPVEHVPGTHFVYNSGATYMLSAIVQRVTGMRLLEYLRPRLFEPLGIADPTWETSPQGIDAGGWGLRITTEAIARFGQLYLQRGVWQGVRLLPEAWVAEATAHQVHSGPSADPDWLQGYGYQFWRCRHDAYRGDGAFGQFCVVMPQQEAVLAITAGTSAAQHVLDLAWKHLLPAMAAAPLAAQPAAQDALARRLAGVRLPSPAGQRHAAVAAQVSGKTFVIAANDEAIEAIRFAFDEDGCLLTIRTGQGLQQIPCGHGAWRRGAAALPGPETLPVAAQADGKPAPVAASGAWADEQTYVVQLWWYETPFGRTLICRFRGDQLRVERHANVSFRATDRPQLKGRLA